MTDTWLAILDYGGRAQDIIDYIARTEVALRAQVVLYCKGCGRKGSEGDVLCLECGKQIGPIGENAGGK